MQRFIFAYEQLLQLRRQLRRQAEQRVLLARQQCEQARQQLHVQRQRLDELSGQLAQNLKAVPSRSVLEACQSAHFVQQAIDAAQEQLVQCEARLRERADQLRQADQQVEVLETLRQEAWQEHQLEIARQEQVWLEDMMLTQRSRPPLAGAEESDRA